MGVDADRCSVIAGREPGQGEPTAKLGGLLAWGDFVLHWNRGQATCSLASCHKFLSLVRN